MNFFKRYAIKKQSQLETPKTQDIYEILKNKAIEDIGDFNPIKKAQGKITQQTQKRSRPSFLSMDTVTGRQDWVHNMWVKDQPTKRSLR
jgi:hypothetical protein